LKITASWLMYCCTTHGGGQADRSASADHTTCISCDAAEPHARSALQMAGNGKLLFVDERRQRDSEHEHAQAATRTSNKRYRRVSSGERTRARPAAPASTCPQ